MSNPNRITAGAAARLLFYAYDATTFLPYTTLLFSSTFSTKLSQQRIGGVWQTGVSLGTILDGTSSAAAIAAGTFVKHSIGDGVGNLYSIDVASSQVQNAGGVDSIRLQLAVTGVVFVPVVHTIDCAGVAITALLPTALVSGRIDASVGSMTAGAVAAIWDALTSGMSTAGSIGKRIVDYLTGDSFVRLGGPAGVSVSADIAAAKTVIDAAASSASTAATQATAAASSAAAVKVVTDKLATGIVQDGGVYQWTENALELAPAGGAGTGARTVTITVNDGTTVLENAIVRMTEGSNTFSALTNASGVAVFNLDDATHTVSITKSGYSYAGTTIVVNGTETATYSMTAITITPGAGDLTTGWLVTRVAGVATEDITIRYQQRQEPASDTGSSYDDTIYSVESDADGLVELAMVRGAYYYVWRGTGKRPELAQLLLIPANAGATYELPSHVGH